MAGAQAQVLSAAQMSLWVRTRTGAVEDLDAAVWKSRTLVRAWCMRRTLFLLPSDELSIFVRGSSRRPAYGLEWAIERASSKQELDRLLDTVVESLSEPRTRGYKLKLKAGGGWGDKRLVQCVDVGDTTISVGYLIHIIGARDVICSGPAVGNESTFVRADRWLPHWKDMPPEKAEGELLSKYLRAFGPATVNDFALWLGLYARDAKEIWNGGSGKVVEVVVDGLKMGILESDLPDLEKAKTDESVVRLLPNFDSFLLGHKSHRDIVNEGNQKQVYRGQGWVSPVLLVDGRCLGVWSYVRRKNELEIRVTLFSTPPPRVKSKVGKETSDLGRFLGAEAVKTVIS
jgi:hypothetical protein